ncbi:hypothetical protein DFH06DRAFT_1191662 [Mycena polygramma]|nr:hypothetical protein DFH06DRAFT_1191662 [Mycena polygramma]
MDAEWTQTKHPVIHLPNSGDASAAASSILTITYCSPDKDGETHHAIVPFPQDYKQAVTAALTLLGKYMADAPQAGDVVLKSRKIRDKEWIWAEFDPANWLLVVQPGSEVGLFIKQVPRSLAPKAATFWRGPVHLVFGVTKVGLTTWTDLMTTGHNPKPRYSINRPASYTEAVEATKECISDNHWSLPKEVNEPGKTLTFFHFKDTLAQWRQFPPQTMTDDLVWKATVPLPLGVMGVIAI